ncbi:MAG: arginine deiminase, partial [Paracoccaceae bacterium]
MIGVEQARLDHACFVSRMRERGGEVFDIQDLPAEALEKAPAARAFVLDRLITPNMVGGGLAVEMRPRLDEMDARLLARHLRGGFLFSDVPDDILPNYLAEAVTGGDFVT